MRAPVRAALVMLLIGAVLLTARLLRLDQQALALAEWLRGAGVNGALAFALAYVLASVAFLPGSILTLMAGFAYGPVLGTALVSPASVAGATTAFLLGRTVARRWVVGRAARHPRFAAIDEGVGRAGFRIVALLRLSPVFPFNLLNYALGLTRVRLRDYVVASFLGMLPGTALYVYLGSLAGSASELAGGRAKPAGTAMWALYGAGFLATVAVALLVTRTARRALERAIPTAADGRSA